MKKNLKDLTLSGLFLALALVFPFLTGQIPYLGERILPLHIPILICGFFLSWPYALAVGFISPLLRFALFGMPPIFPTGIAMSFELATFGFVCAFLSKRSPNTLLATYKNLIITIISGRVAWGIAMFFISQLTTVKFNLSIFITGAFINGLPGIIIQLVLIPILVVALKKTNIFKEK